MDRIRARLQPIDSWEQLKLVMKDRFVQPYYDRECCQKLQQLTKGSRSVEDYYKEMESALMRPNVKVGEKDKIARLLYGMRTELAKVLDLHEYRGFNDLLNKAIKFDRKMKKTTPHYTHTTYSSHQTLPQWSRECPSTRPQTSKSSGANVNPFTSLPRLNPRAPNAPKPNPNQPKPSTRKILCFNCLGKGYYAMDYRNKRVVVMQTNGDYTSQEDYGQGDVEFIHETEESEGERPIEGHLMLIRRVLQSKPHVAERDQRENLFETRALLNEKICNLIIYGGSYTNVARQDMVERLGLSTFKYSWTYNLHWMDDYANVMVNWKVRVPFKIGKYENMVTCDVVKRKATHLLLGRPWKFDQEAMHFRRENMYIFLHGERKFTILPLTPLQPLK